MSAGVGIIQVLFGQPFCSPVISRRGGLKWTVSHSVSSWWHYLGKVVAPVGDTASLEKTGHQGGPLFTICFLTVTVCEQLLPFVSLCLSSLHGMLSPRILSQSKPVFPLSYCLRYCATMRKGKVASARENVCLGSWCSENMGVGGMWERWRAKERQEGWSMWRQDKPSKGMHILSEDVPPARSHLLLSPIFQ